MVSLNCSIVSAALESYMICGILLMRSSVQLVRYPCLRHCAACVCQMGVFMSDTHALLC